MKPNTLDNDSLTLSAQRSKSLFMDFVKAPTVVSEIISFINSFNHAVLQGTNTRQQLDDVFVSTEFQDLLVALSSAPAFSLSFGKQFADAQAVEGISACRV